MEPQNQGDSASPQQIPPQLDVITLQQGQDWTNNWREDMKEFYGYDEDKVPKGFFISLEDLIEMKKSSYPTMAGVRVYFVVKNADGQDPPRQVSGIMVPATLVPGKPEQSSDIIVDVPSIGGINTVSIYDVTRPCPPLCDPKSKLS